VQTRGEDGWHDLNQYRLKGLYSESMQGWCSIKKDGVVSNHLLQYFPNNPSMLIDVSLGGGDVGSTSMDLKVPN
jgi:hypothetical protein